MACYLETPLWANIQEKGRINRHGDLLRQLHSEIMEFCEVVSPTPEEQRLRASAVVRFERIAKHMWPSCEVRSFGSYASGIYLPSSDIDLAIFNSGCINIQSGLRALANRLESLDFASNMEVIGRARVPIIKFEERQSGLSFDVRIDDSTEYPATHSFKEHQAVQMIRHSLVELPAMGPLYMVLKTFFYQERLNEVYHTGGMASYTLFVMLRVFLQTYTAAKHSYRASSQKHYTEDDSSRDYVIEDGLHNDYEAAAPASTSANTPSSRRPTSETADYNRLVSGSLHHSRLGHQLGQNLTPRPQAQLEYGLDVREQQFFSELGLQKDTELGLLLLGFFHFYGICFNSQDYGISCRYGGTFFLKMHRGFYDRWRPYLLAVEDPLTPSNDIGKNSFNYEKIQAAFIKAYETIISSYPTPSLLCCIIPLAKKWASRKYR